MDKIESALSSRAGASRREVAALGSLRAAVARGADERDLLDIAYRQVDTPIGSLLLAATPRGLLRVAFSGEDHDGVLRQLAEEVSPRLLEYPRRLDAAARQIEEYLEGRRTTFEVPLDLRLARGFRLEVLERLCAVPFARTVSYGELAEAVGAPRAARAVGSACSNNPVPLVVPCHRVVRGDGSLGRYGGGDELKARLLELERRVAGEG